ncbi:IPT/TIG domain-containing protein [Streptomyces sp. NPDC058579]|uniref:IPT/TIG domain-containing protein n=1 Tax=Streptomyces sp. NPDC058579 TaxID=3346548 RepID=UPI003662C090
MPISPNQGSTGGGTLVTITGTNLAGTTAVTFGTKPATAVTNVSPTQVTAVSPSGAGSVGVTVTTAGGTSNPIPFFYVGAPFKSSLGPTSSGPLAGGNTVTINGVGLATATSVSFGANSATPTVVSDTQLTVVVPAGAAAGPVGVSVTTAGGTNNGLSYTYVDVPTVTAVTPASGPTSGGTGVTITGTNLGTTGSVTFDGAPAPFTVVNSTTVSAVTPPGTAGAVDVVVTNPAGSDTEVGAFTYVAPPGI